MSVVEQFLHLSSLPIIEKNPNDEANKRYTRRVDKLPTLPIVFDAIVRGDLVSLSWIKAEYPELFMSEYTLHGKSVTPTMYLSMLLSTSYGQDVYHKKTTIAQYLSSSMLG